MISFLLWALGIILVLVLGAAYTLGGDEAFESAGSNESIMGRFVGFVVIAMLVLYMAKDCNKKPDYSRRFGAIGVKHEHAGTFAGL